MQHKAATDKTQTPTYYSCNCNKINTTLPKNAFRIDACSIEL